MHLTRSVVALLLFVASMASCQSGPGNRQPIIDVHLHAFPANVFGPPPVPACAAPLTFSPWDPKEAQGSPQVEDCASPMRSPTTDDELMRQTLQLMRARNVTGVVSGPIDVVRRWKAADSDRIIPGIFSYGEEPIDSIRAWAADGSIRVLGELGFQYEGLSPDDPIPESYFALAEQLDLPVGIHVGLGPPGAAYIGFPKYEMRLSNPLLLEHVLIRHPKLRLYVMHAGWPMIDQIVGLLYAHPQVYVDTGVIDWFVPRKEFHAYLKRLVDAGFEKRIMFGSDQMIWPDALPAAIAGVESADFLTPVQKRDIFYNNAARFLRLPTSDSRKRFM